LCAINHITTFTEIFKNSIFSLQIPNPLFDLAGITCGHFLVPFWTFFGATLIGKAIIKTHLQQLTVIVAFNENLVSSAVSALAKVCCFKFHFNFYRVKLPNNHF
jgi:hypothetical protein